MKKRSPGASAPGGVELFEQAVLLFTGSPARAKFDYLLGAIPFAAAFFYYWITMSRSRAAADNLAIYALVVAILFTWKSVTDGWYCRRLHAHLGAEPDAGISWWGAARSIAWQPLALVAVPLAFLSMVPFAWTFAFFRNLLLTTALGETRPFLRAGRESLRDTKQNWLFLLTLSLAALLLFVNLIVLLILVPQLLRSFFGIESGLVQMGGLILNSTTFGLVALVTYLALDPLISAVYVLRCFRGEAIETGADLRAALRRVAILLLLAITPAANAAESAVDGRAFEQQAAEVLRRDEFAWRLPNAARETPGWWADIQRAFERFGKWISDLLDRWFRQQRNTNPGDDTLGWLAQNTQWILIALALVFVALLVILWMRRRRIPPKTARALPVSPVVDVASEQTTADALPESGWMSLADTLIAQGDFRLALRALYLASIRYLSERRLLTIQFWKSGLDYRRELARRAKATPQVEPEFSANTAVFERVWYGRDLADAALVREFAARLEEMRKHAEA